MGEITKAVKKLMADPFDKDKIKNVLSATEKSNPSSKYLGISHFPGIVKSDQERRDYEKRVGAAQAAKIKLKERNKSSMPSKAEEELMARRRSAASRNRSGGRSSTILSDETLG